MSAASVAAAIERRGQDLILRRIFGRNDVHFDVHLKGVVRGYSPQELVGAIIQGDREVRISNQEILGKQWPGPPRRADRLRISERWVTVESVNTVIVSGETWEHVIQVRG